MATTARERLRKFHELITSVTSEPAKDKEETDEVTESSVTESDDIPEEEADSSGTDEEAETDEDGAIDKSDSDGGV